MQNTAQKNSRKLLNKGIFTFLSVTILQFFKKETLLVHVNFIIILHHLFILIIQLHVIFKSHSLQRHIASSLHIHCNVTQHHHFTFIATSHSIITSHLLQRHIASSLHIYCKSQGVITFICAQNRNLRREQKFIYSYYLFSLLKIYGNSC